MILEENFGKSIKDVYGKSLVEVMGTCNLDIIAQKMFDVFQKEILNIKEYNTGYPHYIEMLEYSLDHYINKLKQD